MAKVYEYIADGTEEIEALTMTDVLRRAGVEVVTVSINKTAEVTMSHGVRIICDTTVAEADVNDADMLLLPGGMPGATNLNDCEAVPGFESQMTGATYTKELFTVDGNVITGEGPAATLPFSYAILEMLGKGAEAEQLREGMMFNHLMS